MSDIVFEATASRTARPPRVMAVASGKGGVGKTNVTANLALTLARRGLRVCVFDADLGLANIDVLFGISPRESLLHVLRGERRLRDVMVEAPGGIHIIPAANGVAELTSLAPQQQLQLLDEMDGLEDAFDMVLIDTAAGISGNVLYFTAAASEALIVITPEPTAITDAYALIKLLATRHGRQEFMVLVNMASGAADARAAYSRLARVVERFLHVQLEYQGYVPFDDAVSRSVREQRPFVLAAPHTPASLAVGQLADCLIRRPTAAATGGVQFFFQRLLAVGGH